MIQRMSERDESQSGQDVPRRSALVTGGSGDLGRAICRALARDGLRVFIHYCRRADGASALAEEIRAAGGQADVCQADLTDGGQVNALIKQVTAHQPLDVLVNNAGETRDKLCLFMSEEDWDRVLDLDLKAAFLCCKAGARRMASRGAGRIINISSVAGIVGSAGQANYSAAKAGLIGLTRALARELGPYGVLVNAVAPGLIASQMASALKPEQAEALVRMTSLGRLGKPEEVAAAVSFLASAGASFITGQTLVVDGGLALR